MLSILRVTNWADTGDKFTYYKPLNVSYSNGYALTLKVVTKQDSKGKVEHTMTLYFTDLNGSGLGRVISYQCVALKDLSDKVVFRTIQKLLLRLGQDFHALTGFSIPSSVEKVIGIGRAIN